MAVTPIKARCRRCGEDFHLYELLDDRSGACPQCGWILTPDWTAKLLEDAAVADIAQRHLVGSLRNLRNLPGNVLLRPHAVLRNLFEEVGWQNELTENPEMLRHELQELRRLLGAWERLDPDVAATQSRRTWFQRAVDWLLSRPVQTIVASTDELPRPNDNAVDPELVEERDPRPQRVSAAS